MHFLTKFKLMISRNPFPISEPFNRPTHDLDKALGTFLPLRVGEVCGGDGERAGVRAGFRLAHVLLSIHGKFLG
jgi:hypothetical protein